MTRHEYSKPCPECGVPFLPFKASGKRPEQQTCGAKACRYAKHRRLFKGQVPVAAIEAVKRSFRARVRQELQARFAPITERDIDVFLFARDVFSGNLQKRKRRHARRLAA